MSQPGQPADPAGSVEPAPPVFAGPPPVAYPPAVDPWAEAGTVVQPVAPQVTGGSPVPVAPQVSNGSSASVGVAAFAGPLPQTAYLPPTPRRRNPAVAVLSVVLLLTGVAAAALLGYHLAGQQVAADGKGDQAVVGDGFPGTPQVDPGPGTDGPDPGGDQGDGEGDPGDSGTAFEDRLGLAADHAVPGDCLVNDGTAEEPVMRIVRCDTDERKRVFRVLAREPLPVTISDGDDAHEAASVAACEGTPGYQFHFFSVQDDARYSYVLCLAVEKDR